MNATQYIIELSKSVKTNFGKKNFSEQKIEQMVFTTVFGSSGSIFMDGFALYFLNSHGESAYFAPKAYNIIGAPKSAELIERASRILTHNPVPENSDDRHVLYNKLSENELSKLVALSEEFYSTGEIIDDLLFNYVKQHSEVFGETPENIEKLR